MIVRDLNLAKHSLKVKDRSVPVSHVGSVFREMLATKRYFEDFLTAEDLAYCKILSQRRKWFLGSKVYNLFGTSDLTSMSSKRRITTTIWRYEMSELLLIYNLLTLSNLGWLSLTKLSFYGRRRSI